jgi:hypothetical protein
MKVYIVMAYDYFEGKEIIKSCYTTRQAAEKAVEVALARDGTDGTVLYSITPYPLLEEV